MECFFENATFTDEAGLIYPVVDGVVRKSVIHDGGQFRAGHVPVPCRGCLLVKIPGQPDRRVGPLEVWRQIEGRWLGPGTPSIQYYGFSVVYSEVVDGERREWWLDEMGMRRVRVIRPDGSVLIDAGDVQVLLGDAVKPLLEEATRIRSRLSANLPAATIEKIGGWTEEVWPAEEVKSLIARMR